MMKFDLHMHSNYSDDGEFTPEILIDKALANEVTFLSITDHNSVKANKQAKCYCADKPISYISGVELDCTIDGINLHVLGYGIDEDAPIFTEIEQEIFSQEVAASQKRIELVRSLEIDFDDAFLQSISHHGVVNGEMIAEAAMVFDSEQQHLLLQPYYGKGERSTNPFVNFYWDYCAQGKPAYVEVKYRTLAEIVSIIHDNGGLAVLAHPGNNTKENLSLLKAIVATGIDGIEAYSSYHTSAQTRFYVGLAQTHDLFVTCGSDFHGKTKPSIEIGSVECPSAVMSNLDKKLAIFK